MRKENATSERIKELCRLRKINYYRLTIRTGIPISTIMNIVHGYTQNPGINTVLNICDALNIEPKDFFDSPLFKNDL